MTKENPSVFAKLLNEHRVPLAKEWLKEQLNAVTMRKDLINEAQLKDQAEQFIQILNEALKQGNYHDIMQPEWLAVREFLSDVSKARTKQGFSSSETATFIFSLKQPLINYLRKEIATDANELANEVWSISLLLDKLGLYTVEIFQKSREEIIKRQQEEMLELSTPVVKLWDGILALPMIGTLDSARTQIVMETLLQRIIETGCEVAIIDITGVPNVDTLVAQHLLKTVTAARLMGADCIISGIRPQIAQTIVHLGVDLEGITTKASLADAFLLALNTTGRMVTKIHGVGSNIPSMTGQLK